MYSRSMGFRSYLSSYETVLTKNKSVNIQRDIISTLTPAVLMSCLDFAFPIPAKTSVDSKILLIAKFRSFTRNPQQRVSEWYSCLDYIIESYDRNWWHISSWFCSIGSWRNCHNFVRITIITLNSEFISDVSFIVGNSTGCNQATTKCF